MQGLTFIFVLILCFDLVFSATKSINQIIKKQNKQHHQQDEKAYRPPLRSFGAKFDAIPNYW